MEGKGSLIGFCLFCGGGGFDCGRWFFFLRPVVRLRSSAPVVEGAARFLGGGGGGHLTAVEVVGLVGLVRRQPAAQLAGRRRRRRGRRVAVGAAHLVLVETDQPVALAGPLRPVRVRRLHGLPLQELDGLCPQNQTTKSINDLTPATTTSKSNQIRLNESNGANR